MDTLRVLVIDGRSWDAGGGVACARRVSCGLARYRRTRLPGSGARGERRGGAGEDGDEPVRHCLARPQICRECPASTCWRAQSKTRRCARHHDHGVRIAGCGGQRHQAGAFDFWPSRSPRKSCGTQFARQPATTSCAGRLASWRKRSARFVFSSCPCWCTSSRRLSWLWKATCASCRKARPRIRRREARGWIAAWCASTACGKLMSICST